MSVSIGASSYDDLDVQLVTGAFVMAQTATVSNQEFEQSETIDPVGGLARGEVAELVAIDAQFYVIHRGGTPTAQNFGQFQYELTSDSEFRGSKADRLEETDVDGVSDLDRETFTEVDVDRLLRGMIGGSAAPLDTTNGAGAGPANMSDRITIPYRDWFGGGPTYDRHNELFLHALLDETGAAILDLGWEIQIWWDVQG